MISIPTGLPSSLLESLVDSASEILNREAGRSLISVPAKPCLACKAMETSRCYSFGKPHVTIRSGSYLQHALEALLRVTSPRHAVFCRPLSSAYRAQQSGTVVQAFADLDWIDHSGV